MRISLLITALTLSCFCCTPAAASDDQASFEALSEILPAAGELDGWIPDGEAQLAKGEDLFLLINGGAEIYLEYGFVACLFQTYVSQDGRSINVEIYEMDGPEAAYGIFTFKRSGNGMRVDVGQEGSYESYYVIFWRGRYLITVIALGEWDGSRADVLQIAGAFDASIDVEAECPILTSFLPMENLQPQGVTYLRGNLALFNQYIFAHEDIFRMKEGVVGEYKEYTVFIFQYDDEAESGKWFESAKDHLQGSRRFDNFVNGSDRFELFDRNDRRLTFKHFKRWILIAMVDKKMNTQSIFDSIEASIERRK